MIHLDFLYFYIFNIVDTLENQIFDIALDSGKVAFFELFIFIEYQIVNITLVVSFEIVADEVIGIRGWILIQAVSAVVFGVVWTP